MFAVYNLSHGARIALCMAVALAVLVQEVALLLNCSRQNFVKEHLTENLLEGAGLLNTLILTALLAQVQNNALDGYLAPSGFLGLRWFAFAVTAVLAVWMCRSSGTYWQLSAVAASAVALPVCESLSGPAYPVFYCAAILFWLFHAICLIVFRKRELKSSISAFSVKEAIDALHGGVMFCEKNGWIVLQNRRMGELMVVLTGQLCRSGKEFYECLQSGQCLSACQRLVEKDELIYRLPDRTVWLFSLQEISGGRKKYLQLSAADVTARWDAEEHIREENKELSRLGEELKERLSHLKEISREEETSRARNQVHDVLGQRITLLLRALREGKEPDVDLLSAFADGLPSDLRRKDFSTAENEVALLQGMMHQIGVDVSFAGTLPEDEECARTFAEIGTEAATNAVRHGFATQIAIEWGKTEDGWTMTVMDNGSGLAGSLKEGGGIRGMRQKLADQGGCLTVADGPKFILTAFLKRREKS